MTNKKILVVVLLASFGLLYRGVLAKLVHDWYIDENYSHGFLIIPLALYLARERQSRFLSAPQRPSTIGLFIVFASVGLLLAGVLGAEVFTTEMSMLGVIAGSVVYLFGWQHFRVMLFPIAVLLLMIPIPAIIFNQIAFPLQLLASKFGESTLIMCQIPVLREGNVIHLANTSLEVAEACSGIRSLISLLTLSIIYGYWSDSRLWVRYALAITTIPVAIAANGIRVSGTGVAAHYYGAAAAEGFFHTFSGWLVFVIAFLMLFLIHHLLSWVVPKNRRPVSLPVKSAVRINAETEYSKIK